MSAPKRLATLTIEEAHLPLSDANRAMLIQSLRDILKQYEAGEGAADRVCLHIINVPTLPRRAIHSEDCGTGAR